MLVLFLFLPAVTGVLEADSQAGATAFFAKVSFGGMAVLFAEFFLEGSDFF